MELSKTLGLVLYDEPDKFQITGDENSLNHNFEIIEEAIENMDDKIADCEESVSDAVKLIGDQNEKIEDAKKYVNNAITDLRTDIAGIVEDAKEAAKEIEDAKDEVAKLAEDVQKEVENIKQDAKDSIDEAVEKAMSNAKDTVDKAVEEAMSDAKDSIDKAVEEATESIKDKQDKLVAGENIKIDGNVISAIIKSENVHTVVSEDGKISEEINKAIEDADGEPVVIEIPAGDYVIDKPIVPTGDVTIKGSDGTTVTGIADHDEPLIDLSGCDTVTVENVNFKVDDNSPISAIVLPDDATVTDCVFEGFGGTAIEGGSGAKVEDCDFINVGEAISIDDGALVDGCSFENVAVGISVKSEHNIITNVKFENCGSAIVMSGDSNDNVISNFIISGCETAAIELHGNGNMISGHICNAGKKHSGKSVDTIDMEKFGHEACAIYMNDAAEDVTNHNKINVTITRVDGLPMLDMFMRGGNYIDNIIDITTNNNYVENAPHFEPLKFVIGGREKDKVRAFFRGIIRINGAEYYLPERTAYPFDANYIFLNNYLIGNTRAADSDEWKAPTRAGLFMNYSWDDDYYMSVYNQDEEKYEWMLINPIQIDSTLTVAGKAADARATGKNDNKIQSQITSLLNRIIALENKHGVNANDEGGE